MTDIEQGRFKPSSTNRDELPTAFGGTNPVEPDEPGQSLGQVPDPADASVDEAGDRPAASGSQREDDDETDEGQVLLGG